MKRTMCVYGIAALLMCLILAGCKVKPTGSLDADFGANTTTGSAPLTVQFTDTSTPGDLGITAWHWLFGDGAESPEQDPTHVYATAGTYNVSLEVTTSTESDTELKVNYITVSTVSPEGESEGEPEMILLPGNIPLELVRIPAGTFTMGSPDTELDRDSDETQHSVTLNSFWMGKYELTQAQWKAVMGGANPSHFQGGSYGNTDNYPVETVSWNDVQLFITALNAHITATGQGAATMRLPSESQWEYACRAGNHVPPTRFYWGDDLDYADILNNAWLIGNSLSQTHNVGEKTVNDFGLYDMSGNVREWCQDWYHADYAAAPTDGSAWEVPAGLSRILRGGGWYQYGDACRSAYRTYREPYSEFDYLGFRLVR